MKTNILFILMGMLCLFVIACEPAASAEEPEVDMEAVKAEIQAMEDAYAAGVAARDPEAIIAYYADDAMSLPAEEPIVEGRAAILARLQSEMAEETDESDSSVRFEVVDITVAGDLVIEVGRSYVMEANGEEETGKFISVFEKRDGKYVCIRDIWNSSRDDDEDEMEEDMDSEGGDMEEPAEGSSEE